MYSVDNTYYYKIWDAIYQEYTHYCYSEDELVTLLSKYYRKIGDDVYNYFIDHCACSPKDKGDKRYQVFDNYERIINVKDYEQLAFIKWRRAGFPDYSYEFLIDSIMVNKRKRRLKYYLNNSGYRYRMDPVPRTGKRSGGGWYRKPRTTATRRMYSIPEYKKYNRGSFKEIPSDWDDAFRTVQRSWKKQRRYRHQWQR